MNMREINSEVLYADDKTSKANRMDIELLRERAINNKRKRSRLCMHKSEGDLLHEMLIIHTKGVYIRPHKHLNKIESHHIIAGTADAILFDDTGGIVEIIKVGDYRSGRIFFYRISEPTYHTLLIATDTFVFHETTSGPFNRSDTVFAPWAPEEDDSVAVATFMKEITKATKRDKTRLY